MYRKLKPPILTTEGIIGIVALVVFIVLLILSFKTAMAFDRDGNVTVNIITEG